MQTPTPAGQVHQPNHILAALPRKEIAQIQPHLEAMSLRRGFELHAINKPVEYIYFLYRGVASMTTSMENGDTVEVATIGPEGMVGIPIFLADEQMPIRAFIQVEGDGSRIEAEAFRHILKDCPTLNRVLLRYTLALINQIAQNVACNRTHAVEQRCARWLLMTQDRMHSPTFFLTQEFMAQMLGVRRPTVSIAAGILAKANLISYVRGEVTVRDRAGLEAAACECYRTIISEFERLVGTRG
jgi:CRP-like cAMP-binding protein